MIKIHKHRYNSNAIQNYYPYDDPSNNPCIVLVWRENRSPDKIITFEDKEERDMHISAMDEVMLIVKDGIVVDRGIELPFALRGGPFEGSGGINLQ